MRDLLVTANRDLLHQIQTLQDAIGAAVVPAELTPYRGQVEKACDELRHEVRRNLKDLEHGIPASFVRVLRQTQRVTRFFDVVNSRFAGPAIRSRVEDRVGLIVLRWLHDEHPKAVSHSFAMSDGNFAIYPTEEWPALYFMPSSRQQTLHYLPLLFHEFGHLLYVLHEQEMDELVADFQQVVSDELAPKTVRQRSKVEKQERFRQQAVLRWYEWVQEFFCDAVGLTIGGPCFLQAFWHYFRARSSEEFFLPREKQMSSGHPVTWLRVRMLVDRAKKLGLADLADEVDAGWHATATLLRVREDYEGLWSDQFFVPLRETLDDMLEECHPRPFGADDLSGGFKTGTPLRLLNRAWIKFRADPDKYRAWEKSAINAFVQSR
jgi:hypothetical protein